MWLRCALVVACSLAPPARSEEAGFGGVPAAEAEQAAGQGAPGFGAEAGAGDAAPEEAESECLLRDESGAWVPCNLLMPPAVPAATAPSHASPPALPRPPREGSGPPKVEEPPSRRFRSPFDAIERAAREQAQVWPLVTLREEVAAARAKLDELGSGRPPADALARQERELALIEAVLSHVEQMAQRRMGACLRRLGLPEPVRAPTFRMTPGGPVPLTPTELAAQVPLVETYPCERVRVIDEATIADVRRYYEVVRTLDEESFGWRRREERRALEAEERRLLDRVAADDPLRHYRPKKRR